MKVYLSTELHYGDKLGEIELTNGAILKLPKGCVGACLAFKTGKDVKAYYGKDAGFLIKTMIKGESLI